MAFNILGCLVIISVHRVSRVYRVLTHALTSPPHPVYDCDSIRHLSIIGVSDPTLTSRQLLPLPPDADKVVGGQTVWVTAVCAVAGLAERTLIPSLSCQTPHPLSLSSRLSLQGVYLFPFRPRQLLSRCLVTRLHRRLSRSYIVVTGSHP